MASANITKPMSAPVYPTHQGAQSAALRMAREASPSGKVEFVPFSGGEYAERAVRPIEGGPAFASKMLIVDWQVEQLDADELARRVVIGRRRLVDDLRQRAEAAKARARELLGSKFEARHHAEARRLLTEAESLLGESA